MSKRIKGLFMAGLVIVASIGAIAYFTPAHAVKRLECVICGPQHIHIVTCGDCPSSFQDQGTLCYLSGCNTNDPFAPKCDYSCTPL